MPILNITEEQVIALLEQLTLEQRTRVLNRFATVPANGSSVSQPAAERPRPTRGKAKDHILYLADDFDAPLEHMTDQPIVKHPRPCFGSGKDAIRYMADDFDAPLEDMKEYKE